MMRPNKKPPGDWASLPVVQHSGPADVEDYSAAEDARLDKALSRYDTKGCHYCGSHDGGGAILGYVGRAVRAVCPKHAHRLHRVVAATVYIPEDHPITQAYTACAKAGVDLFKGKVDLSDPSAPWSVDDRAWFTANPGRSHRLRPAFPGEWPPGPSPVPGAWLASLVRQAEPGARARIPRWFLAEDPDSADEQRAHALFAAAEMERTLGRPLAPGEWAQCRSTAEPVGSVQ